MMKQSRIHEIYILLALILQGGGSSGYAKTAADLLQETGVKGGLIVHVGCGDGQITAALQEGGAFLVQGLDRDGGNIRAAREHFQELGLGGKVSASQWQGGRLPYADNLVNLLFLEEQVAREEVLRVLAPEGAAYRKSGDRWEKVLKPRPETIDAWTHFLHDPGNNAVARDSVVGPPRHMQWLAAPAWSRNHHTLASISSVVSNGGKIFYILDEATSASLLVPGKWFLVARDAFNGILLWKRRIPSWAWHRHGFRAGPVQLPRTVVTEGDRVYVPLGMSAPVSSIHASTGKTLRTLEDTAGAEELIINRGILLVLRGSPMAEQAAIDPARRGKKPITIQKTIVAARADTGSTLWKWADGELGNPTPLTLASRGERVFFAAGETVVSLDLHSGKEVWRYSPKVEKKKRRAAKKSSAKKIGAKKARGNKKAQARYGWSVATLVASEGIIFWADGKKMQALSSGDGKPLWSCDCKAGFRSPVDVFVAGGLVWIGPDYTIGRDPRTGKIEKRTIPLGELMTAGHHHRCYREKATSRFIIGGYRGLEFFDLAGDNHSRNNWIRGTCQYGILPCNGLVYMPSHACGCYMEAKLIGFWALSPSAPSGEVEGAERGDPVNRLVKGPGENPGAPSGAEDDSSSADWPTYRHDGARSGVAGTVLPGGLKRIWLAEVGGRLSSPTAAGGRLFVSSVDAHSLSALDGGSGKVLWRFPAGGRIDSPPTIHRGLALFGSTDGWIHCLRASDGKLLWRFQAAPGKKFTVAHDRVESIWPAHGSVLLQDGLAYAAAGRSSHLDGGIYLYALDPTTGRVAHRNRVCSAHPGGSEGEGKSNIERVKITQNATDYKTFTQADRSDAFSMKGATNDVLVGDGSSVYLRHLRFRRNLVAEEKRRPHLFSTSQLLDGTEAHRSHLVYGTGDFSRTPVAYSWIAYKPGNYGSRLSVPYGLMIVFDEQTVQGVRRTGGYGYQLFSARNTATGEIVQNLPDFRKWDKKKKEPGIIWTADLPVRPRAMLRSGDLLFIAGMPRETDGEDPHAAYEGRRGGLLLVFSARDGAKMAEYRLPSPPVWEGMAAARGCLYLTLMDGSAACFTGIYTVSPGK